MLSKRKAVKECEDDDDDDAKSTVPPTASTAKRHKKSDLQIKPASAAAARVDEKRRVKSSTHSAAAAAASSGGAASAAAADVKDQPKPTATDLAKPKVRAARSATAGAGAGAAVSAANAVGASTSVAKSDEYGEIGGTFDQFYAGYWDENDNWCWRDDNGVLHRDAVTASIYQYDAKKKASYYSRHSTRYLFVPNSEPIGVPVEPVDDTNEDIIAKQYLEETASMFEFESDDDIGISNVMAGWDTLWSNGYPIPYPRYPVKDACSSHLLSQELLDRAANAFLLGAAAQRSWGWEF